MHSVVVRYGFSGNGFTLRAPEFGRLTSFRVLYQLVRERLALLPNISLALIYGGPQSFDLHKSDEHLQRQGRIAPCHNGLCFEMLRGSVLLIVTTVQLLNTIERL